MKDTSQPTSAQPWTSIQAYSLAIVCLLVGIAGGWLLRGSQAPSAGPAESASLGTADQGQNAGTTQAPSPEQMQRMAATQAAPLIEKLKSDPNNPDLLASIGNIYYDTQLFSTAIDYYQRVLKVQPTNAAVRTDMATAYWYTGDADTAIAEFNKALSYEPNKPNALFNLGIVEWQGKMDIKAAVATWQKLLATNPNYEGRAKVEELMAQAMKHSNINLAQQANKSR